MSVILPPESLGNKTSLVMQSGNTGVLFRLQDVSGQIPSDIGEIVVPWSRVGAMIDTLTEWRENNAPKHHHIFIDPAAIGAVIP